MNYICIRWKHSSADDPVLLYSEIDEKRFETRKVEVFADGKRGYASSTESSGTTQLGKAPIPALVKISYDPQFEPAEITKGEFEGVWEKRKSG
jgi:hypothetical protein